MPVANPPALVTTDGANFSYNTLDFAPDTEESCYWEKPLAPDYAGEDIFLIIKWKSTAIAGNVKWGVSVLGREAGEVFDVALGTEQTIITTTENVAGELVYSLILPFPPSLSPNDTLIVKLARKAADAADTMLTDALVMEVFLVWATVSIISTITPITPTDVAPAIFASYEDVDCGALIASGATGVLIHWENADPTTARMIGLRKKGSTDDWHGDIFAKSHGTCWVGVDENRFFQCYLEAGIQRMWVIAYTTAGCPFFTNAKDKSLAGTGAWTDINLAADCPSAKLVFCEIKCDFNNPPYGFRKKGSTDNIQANCMIHNWGLAGCDDSQVIEHIIDHATLKTRVLGYATEGVSMRDNAVNVSPVADGAYHVVDCSSYALGAKMLFFAVQNTGASGDIAYAIRKNGSIEDIYLDCGLTTFPTLLFFACECDADQKVEIKLENSDIKVHLLGYSV